MKIRILFVEADLQVRELLLQTVAQQYHATAVRSAEEAVEQLEKEAFDIVVLDLNLPGMSGLDLLQHCPRLKPGIITIAITAHATIETAVEAMKRGATEFLMKPLVPEDLLSSLSVAAERVSRQALSASSGMAPVDIVAESPVMHTLLNQATSIAPFNTTVLVTGETGTGKELIARAIHQHSPRANKPLVALNCAAIPEQLLEDELFGHVKGAFTGAHAARIGRFEQADGGTLFLDEIGDMSLPLQAKLLRVLQEREFEKLGSSRTTKVDVRIVAATSADLEKRVSDGSFRADLYYRLNVVHLRLPALRLRKEDIRPLAQQLMARFCLSAGLPLKSIAPEVWHVLNSYYWPGNVRQLQNAMERAAALSGARLEIQLADLPEEVRGGAEYGVSTPLTDVTLPTVGTAIPTTIPDEGLSYEAVVATVERELLLKSLKKTGGNKVRAAKLLQMKRTTFAEKLKRLQPDSENDLLDEYQAS
ncbi:MAG: sigma-54-dependent Fis family transcriptional regulator [Acidobacteria bacterium]|nr:sigma-54-dependent Fis family transcriptional regulator [Acidobacteriota bacterium]